MSELFEVLFGPTENWKPLPPLLAASETEFLPLTERRPGLSNFMSFLSFLSSVGGEKSKGQEKETALQVIQCTKTMWCPCSLLQTFSRGEHIFQRTNTLFITF